MTFRTLLTGLGLVALLAGPAAAGELGSIKNLERERAALVGQMLSTELTPEQRLAAIQAAQRRLVDMERMVIRDQRLQGSLSPLVQRTFADYELSFMVHASAESEQVLTDFWLTQVGLTTDELLATRRGRR